VRFLADGPELPDDLLVARDEGRVLFFCGSGVSIAKAGLKDFFGLARSVLDELRALPDSAPRQLMTIAGALQEQRVAGVGSILAADRLFGLLERDFSAVDITRAVGKVLAPEAGVDLSAHRILIDLSRTENRTVQLVTTNFDLLFEKAAPQLPIWTPNNLPNLRRGAFHGIVHLHGMLDRSYGEPSGGDLVLSSAEFGRAYLSEGWATSFIQDATERYIVVFVGYTADDPPVQYLLEALSRGNGRQRQPMYAFQPGMQSEAKALWAHKGVTAIPYDVQLGHRALWQTLSAWAERSRNPEAWRQAVLRRARVAPERLAPHERGQVMHLALTPEGTKSIVEAKRKLAADWLLVMDPQERYETRGRRSLTPEDPACDPFRDYGLDSDPLPKLDEDGNFFRQREVPKGVLDAFIANPFDTGEGQNAALFGDGAVAHPALPIRLRALSGWIAHVAGDPVAIWWALGKPNLHSLLLHSIEARLKRGHDQLPEKSTRVWRYILKAREPRYRSHFATIYGLEQRIADEGWSTDTRRALIELLRPRLKVERPFASGPVKSVEQARLFDLVSLSMTYSEDFPRVQIPDGELAAVTPLARRLLEDVSELEQEISLFGLNHTPPINPDPRLEGRTYERTHGLNRLVFWYVALLKRLLALDVSLARREFEAWQGKQNTLFDRLRVWACGVPDFLPSDLATRTLADLTDDAFWTERGQRDLLVSLQARWAAFEAPLRSVIEARLLKGPPRLDFMSRETHRQWNAHTVLDRVLWLMQQGCRFERKVDAALAKARTAVPEWKDEYATHAADSREASGGKVDVNQNFDAVKESSIEELLNNCIAAAARDRELLVDRDPIAGLAADRPIRLLRALLLGNLPDDQSLRWAWSKFFQSAARREDTRRRTSLIAHRLNAISDATFALILRSVCFWLEARAAVLYAASPTVMTALIGRILATLVSHPENDGDAKKEARDWLNASRSSPVGIAVQVLLSDPILPGIPLGGTLPPNWKRDVEFCLALAGDEGVFALAQLSRCLGWLLSRDRTWVEKEILPVLDAESDRRDSLLVGFLNAQPQVDRLLYGHLKKPVFGLISGELANPIVDIRSLVQFVLVGWMNADDEGRLLSDADVRTSLVRGAQEFRIGVLWHVDQWDFADKHYFLSQIWPLQLAARSPIVTERLCAIAIKDGAHFGELAEAIMPFLTPVRHGAMMFASEVDNANDILAASPDLALEMYWRIMPEDSVEWPYEAHRGLEHLYKSVKSLRSHPHMVELMRRRRKGYF
jgi:hypothetical protein